MTDQTHLYRHFDAGGRLLYVGISLSALKRLSQHRKAAHWFASIANVTIETFPSRQKAVAAENLAIKTENPKWNTMLSTESSAVSIRQIKEDHRRAGAGARRVHEWRRTGREAKKAERSGVMILWACGFADASRLFRA
jgi:excinuclease UvrABC nuclease subunit